MGSRSVASNAGLNHGSKRRSMCTILSDVFDSQFLNAEPVFAGGTGRLLLESIAAFMRVLLTGSAGPGSPGERSTPLPTPSRTVEDRSGALGARWTVVGRSSRWTYPPRSAGDCRGEGRLRRA